MRITDDWPLFRANATEAVRKGFQPEHVSGYSDTLLFQICALPSFDSLIGWQLYRRDPVIYRRHPIENAGLPRFVATRTIWLQQQDAGKFSSPVTSLEFLNRFAPALRFDLVELDPEWIQAIIDKLLNLCLPPFVNSNVIGLDGTRHEMIWDEGMTLTKLNWWGEGPAEWQPLIDIVMPLFDHLEALCNGGENENEQLERSG